MLRLGLQLYTLRDLLEEDFKGTLAKVAELGYQGVEFHHFYGHSAEEVKAMLDEYGLEVLGTHVQYTSLLEDLDSVIAYHKGIGNKNIVVPYLSEEQRSSWPQIFTNLQEIGSRLKQEGLVLLYHNHDFELTEKIGGRTALDALYDSVPADVLLAELDTCWIHFAGYSPIEYIQAYEGRLPIVHWKDVKRKEDGSPLTVELGQGEVDVAAVGDAAEQAGVEWIVVEQDICTNPPLESIEASLNWIKQYAAGGGKVHV